MQMAKQDRGRIRPRWHTGQGPIPDNDRTDRTDRTDRYHCLGGDD
jgi:hypothetical protein